MLRPTSLPEIKSNSSALPHGRSRCLEIKKFSLEGIPQEVILSIDFLEKITKVDILVQKNLLTL